MTILLNNNGYGNACWAREITQLLPDMSVHVYPDIPDPMAIRYALVWDHPDGDLQRYPNLRAILSLGAGVEHLTRDPDLPNVPVIRLADPAVARDMAHHSLYWVLNFHRHYHRYATQQPQKHWQRHQASAPADFQVGVLGLGQIGQTVARTIAGNGYAVSGWDLSEKHLPQIACHHGGDALAGFLTGLDLVINCLPLTPATAGMIDDDFLARLPEGAFLVNISRGGVIDHDALLGVLDRGYLAAAALDAFETEPLPETSPLWQHDGIHITPHMSGATYARSAARIVAENIHRLERGETPYPLYDRRRGF
ncbi:2-hydroxyacid dehydrogenase [Aestuariispira insulae]|uniref:Glyoxylate/hydroxypyruvate reductase A n=1 Tax=Aestuariispira insulae TaxID=1461337 RepID=A0A3D9HGF8_9PROT|nr:glyoxylate/hydroxypyruvate reductase A [Aestuariispira insulae]RED48567.1 glyoxylate/hydroxypyruvate reductase A [Aestuariispira insulae]